MITAVGALGLLTNMLDASTISSLPSETNTQDAAIKMNAGKFGTDMLEGAEAIAAFLSELGGKWNRRRVWHAGQIGSLPIRKKPGIGVYAFKSELITALKYPQTRLDHEA